MPPLPSSENMPQGKIGFWKSCAGDVSRCRRLNNELDDLAKWIFDGWLPAVRNLGASAVMFWCLGGRPDDPLQLDFDAISQSVRHGTWPLTKKKLATALRALAAALPGIPRNGGNRGPMKIVSYHGSLERETKDGQVYWPDAQWGMMSNTARNAIFTAELDWYRSFTLTNPGELEVVVDCAGNAAQFSTSDYAFDVLPRLLPGASFGVEPLIGPDSFLGQALNPRPVNAWVMANTLRRCENAGFPPSYDAFTPQVCAARGITINVLVGDVKQTDIADVHRWLDAGFNVWLSGDACTSGWANNAFGSVK